jgi:transposase
VLDPGRRRTKEGGLWTCSQRAPLGRQDGAGGHLFYSPNRKGEHPGKHLDNYHGVLHADGYGEFRDLYEPKKLGEEPAIFEAACMAHVRSKLFDLTVADR